MNPVQLSVTPIARVRASFPALILALALAPFAFGATPAAAPQFLSEEAAVIQVLDLSDQRLGLMPAVAATKWRTHSPITDPERERLVIKHAGELAAPLGLSSEPVERVFEIQVRLARELEAHLTEQWGAKGFDFAGPVPDLATQLRPQIDTVTTKLLRALYLAAPALQRPEFINHYSALASEHLHNPGWSDESRRELLAALAGVRPSASPALQRIKASGVLRVGMTGDYAPFSVETSGALSGADVELARQLAVKLGAEPVFVRTSWPTLLEELRANDFDVVMGGVSVTPERQALASFSTPYSSGGKTLITRCRDAARYHDLAAVDRARVRIVVNPGGTNEQFVHANIHKAQVRVYPDNRTIFDEIRQDRADVMITDDTEVELQTHRHSDLCRPFAGTFTHADKAILMPKDAELVTAVNSWLSAQIATGEPSRLLRESLEH